MHTANDLALINMFYDMNITAGKLVIDGGTFDGNVSSSSKYEIIYNQSESLIITINNGIFDSRCLISGNRLLLKVNGMTLFNSETTSNSIYKSDIGRQTYGDIMDLDHSAYIRKW